MTIYHLIYISKKKIQSQTDIKKCEEAPANHNTHTDTTLYEMHTNVISLSWSLHADGRLIVNVRVNVI